MKLREHSSVADLLATVEPYLLRDEVTHGLLLGILARLERTPRDHAMPPPFLFSIEERGVVVGVAIRTPPHNLVLSRLGDEPRDEALAMLATTLCARRVDLPGVYGPVGIADRFATEWSRIVAVRSRMLMQQLEFELQSVVAPPATDGARRLATSADVPELAAFAVAFIDESGLPAADRAASSAERIAKRVAAGEFHAWAIADRVVTMASVGGTQRVPRIGFVYTLPSARRRGYASALVASMSQRLLDDGCSRVALSTDAANPTSNEIYRAIGFRQVGAATMIQFE